MKTLSRANLALIATSGLILLGCAEPRTVYVPVSQPPPGYAGQPTYVYPQQNAYGSQPLVTQTPAAPDQPGSASSAQPALAPPQPAQEAPPPNQVVVSQPPPPPQVEVVPMAPGPDYAWTPGYWAWNGGWVWVGGSWALRPHPGVIWIGPRWEYRGHGYYYRRGHWR